jgi:hypothetical protein
MGCRICKPSPEELLSQHDWVIRIFVVIGLIGAVFGFLATIALALGAAAALATLTDALANISLNLTWPSRTPGSGMSLEGLLLLLSIPPLLVATQILGAIWEGSVYIGEHLQSLPVAAELIRGSLTRLWP